MTPDDRIFPTRSPRGDDDVLPPRSPGGDDDVPSPGAPGGQGPGPRIREKKTDDSWKEKAREEKEKLADTAGREDRHALPPATFIGLIEELSLRAMFSLGQIRQPGVNEVYLDLETAKYTIDTLEVLQAKTKGNLDRDEEASLADVLHSLRLLYVHVVRSLPIGAAPAEAGGDEPAAGGPQGSEGPEAGREKPGPKIIL